MTRINLLPWREELRKHRQQQFIVMVFLAAVAAAAVWGLVHMQLNAQIDNQRYRNNLLQQQIALLNKRIAKIQTLEATKKKLLARMDIIQKLQQGRPQVVHMFDELVKTLPDGVYLSTVKQHGGQLLITGVAESNARVSNYMENLDGSNWFSDPNLDVINVTKEDGVRLSHFTLNVKEVNKAAAKEGA